MFNFILVQGLLIATGAKQRAQQAHLSTFLRMWVVCHLRSAVGPLASADHAGIVVGHASQTGAAVARGYSDCTRAPYSCKVQIARLRYCARALCWQPRTWFYHRLHVHHTARPGMSSTESVLQHVLPVIAQTREDLALTGSWQRHGSVRRPGDDAHGVLHWHCFLLAPRLPQPPREALRPDAHGDPALQAGGAAPLHP